MMSGVPILKHFMVLLTMDSQLFISQTLLSQSTSPVPLIYKNIVLTHSIVLF